MTNTQDFFNYTTKFFNTFPKTTEEGKELLNKVNATMAQEAANVKAMATSYTNIFNGRDASVEMTNIAQKAIELSKTATFVSALAVPGALFMMPFLVDTAKKYNMDVVPQSISDNFNL